ncbi:hypothetical protein OOK48_35280 [Streptomyces viridodiastaticus]|uniref:hypothetical protein n=1 Tax=Streptomyces albogriseolus TaxID=1887 RepID=UPI00224C9280|nr:hypothetical protein [Streptomyces viridodiastaticus]MCX4571585.1 hypothetical protein [Streptomyces viridodiastaticus]
MSHEHQPDDCPMCGINDAIGREAEANEAAEEAAERAEREYQGYKQRIANLEYGIDAALEQIADVHDGSDLAAVLEDVRHFLTTYRNLP